MMEVKWCANCNVPIIGEQCDICGSSGRRCAKDLKPIFGGERRLFEKLLGIRLPLFAFRYRNKVISNGRTFLTFKLDTVNKRLIPLSYQKSIDYGEGMDFWEGIRCTIEANEEHLKKREEKAIDFINEAARNYSRTFVLFGGGKDSAVVAMLAKKALGNVSLLFVDTTLEFPETYKFVEEFSRTYGFYLIKDDDGEYYRAKQDFFQLCKRLGPPSIYCRWCCHIFKEQPVKHFIDDHLNDPTDAVFLTGIRRSESKRRSDYASIELGRRIVGQTLIQPINDWSDLEVWLYIFWKGIKINDLYELGHTRVGCWPCPCTPPFMDLIRQLTHASLWAKFEEVLLDYATKNNRSKEWVEKGLWRLRKPKRQKIFVSPFHIKEDGDDILFEYLLPHKPTLFEWLKTLGEIEIDEDKFFKLKTKRGFEVKCSNEGTRVRLIVKCAKKDYVDVKTLIEKALFRYLNCIKCGACSGSCPKGAIQIIERGRIIINLEKCDRCYSCIKNPCIIQDSEKMYIIKLDAFLLTPCEKSLPMNHVIFPSEEIGKRVAEALKTRGVNVEIHEKGRIVCIDTNISKGEIERLVFHVLEGR
jgi:phosphoadenosine phosphosulfate reductase